MGQLRPAESHIIGLVGVYRKDGKNERWFIGTEVVYPSTIGLY